MQEVNQILEQKAVRITPMRQLLLEFFLRGNTTMGLLELEKQFPKADRITMYRTLKTFVEKGILHSIDNGTTEVKYALCKEHCTTDSHVDQHPHFHCLKCKKITCLESLFIPSMKAPASYVFQEVAMTIKGICPGCPA